MDKTTFRYILQGTVAGNHDDLEIILEMYKPLIDKHCYVDGKFDEDLRQYILMRIALNISKFII